MTQKRINATASRSSRCHAALKPHHVQLCLKTHTTYQYSQKQSVSPREPHCGAWQPGCGIRAQTDTNAANAQLSIMLVATAERRRATEKSDIVGTSLNVSAAVGVHAKRACIPHRHKCSIPSTAAGCSALPALRGSPRWRLSLVDDCSNRQEPERKLVRERGSVVGQGSCRAMRSCSVPLPSPRYLDMSSLLSLRPWFAGTATTRQKDG